MLSSYLFGTVRLEGLHVGMLTFFLFQMVNSQHLHLKVDALHILPLSFCMTVTAQAGFCSNPKLRMKLSLMPSLIQHVLLASVEVQVPAEKIQACF